MFDIDGRFSHLKPNDVAVVRFGDKDDRYLQVTHRFKATVEDLLKEDPGIQWQIKRQIERDPDAKEAIEVIETRVCHRHQFEKQ